jgi:hypothetical protein
MGVGDVRHLDPGDRENHRTEQTHSHRVAGLSKSNHRRVAFAPHKDGATFVSITESGFTGDADELVKQVTDSTGGFSLVLAGLKAFLEHNVELNLVADRFPEGIEHG